MERREDGLERQGSLFPIEVEGPFAQVVLNRPLEQVLTYRIPENLRGVLQAGQRLKVPLGRGNQEVLGYCVGVTDRVEVREDRIKDLVSVVDDPPLIDESMLSLTRWIAGYYACTWGQALDAAVPAPVKRQAGTRVMSFLTLPVELKALWETLEVTSRQREVLAVLAKSTAPLTLSDVCRMAKVTPGTVSALRKRGYIAGFKRRLDSSRDQEEYEETTRSGGPEPTEEQAAALSELKPMIDRGGFAPVLLHGVTGSGKTEVYLDAIDRVVEAGGEAIVLVPEISLTPQTIRRFRQRFARVAVLHSHLTDVERHRHWRAIARGEIEVVVGARSAVFAPARKLGLIVVDEEHETSFKQETSPRYNARDVAVKRAQIIGIPIILGSATPSLESWRNAEVGRYRLLTLAERVGGRTLPEVSLVDMRVEKNESGRGPVILSGVMRRAIEDALADGGQVILLLNRRGFHTFALCPKCGNVIKCEFCDVSMTYHKERERLICHMCDAEREALSKCPMCGVSNLFYGGVGTERLEREVRMLFPGRVLRRMDSDTMRSHGSHERVLGEFREGSVDILLGTQMIAKGLDFPNVTLVGVVNADVALHLPDFRAGERTFQLVAQVAGRTGRGARGGRVLVQTYTPEHAAIRLARRHDYLGFVAQELPEREQRGVPPYGKLVRLVARGPAEGKVREAIEKVSFVIRQSVAPGVSMLGPSAAPITKIRNLFRYHLQLRSSVEGALQELLRAVLPQCMPKPPVELAVDVDPVSAL